MYEIFSVAWRLTTVNAVKIMALSGSAFNASFSHFFFLFASSYAIVDA